MKLRKNWVRVIILMIILIATIVYSYFEFEREYWIGDNYSNDILKATASEIEIDESKVNIFFFDVGQGDSTLIISDGKTMLIDAGNDWDGDTITNYLNAIGVTKIDYLVATHAHADHIGGMDTIIRNFEIGRLHMPETDHPTLQVRQFLEAMAEAELQYELLEIGDMIVLGYAYIEVMHVDNTKPSNLNSSSIVLEKRLRTSSIFIYGRCRKRHRIRKRLEFC